MTATTPQQEREAIVRWLRGQCRDPMLPTYAEFLSDYADAIERGDHIKGDDNAKP